MRLHVPGVPPLLQCQKRGAARGPDARDLVAHRVRDGLRLGDARLLLHQSKILCAGELLQDHNLRALVLQNGGSSLQGHLQDVDELQMGAAPSLGGDPLEAGVSLSFLQRLQQAAETLDVRLHSPLQLLACLHLLGDSGPISGSIRQQGVGILQLHQRSMHGSDGLLVVLEVKAPLHGLCLFPVNGGDLRVRQWINRAQALGQRHEFGRAGLRMRQLA
mmetsp:Transcript_102496/g.294060  ORF Transcript_102496/g.294060 Transcript_102496/m.294060 type:complete len:218 (+) Transcript_102496:128-781(+)